MTLPVAGLALFVLLHLIPSVPPLRPALVARRGEVPCRDAFPFVALASPAMVVEGFAALPFEPACSPRAGAAPQ